MSWTNLTPDARAKAVALYQQGRSMAEIAAYFQVTRNVVAGWVSRNRDLFPLRGPSMPRPRQARPAPRPLSQKNVAPRKDPARTPRTRSSAQAIRAAATAAGTLCDFGALRPEQCRWIFDDPCTSLLSCGLPVDPNPPNKTMTQYCPGHLAIAMKRSRVGAVE